MLNWVDLLIIIILSLFTLESLGKPFLLELLDLVSFLLAFLLSLKFYNLPSQFFTNYFQISRSIATILGFTTIWYIVEAIIYSLGKVLLSQKSFFINRTRLNSFSFIPGMLRGIVIVATVLIIMAAFPIQPRIRSAIENSKIASFLLSQSYQLEAPLKSVFGGLANDTLTFLTVEPKEGESVNLGFTTKDFYFDRGEEQQMVDLVNQERVSRGFKALRVNQALTKLAESRSADMYQRGYFSHYTPEGKTVADFAQSQGIEFMVIGENLAYAPTLTDAHQGLMNSPGHRANILSPGFNQIGIGVASSSVYGLMIAQEFTN